MGSLAKWWLRRNPCFECAGDSITVMTPWIELQIELPIDAEISGYRGHYEVTNDPFSTSNEYTALCPYCASEDLLYDEYDRLFDDDDGA